MKTLPVSLPLHDVERLIAHGVGRALIDSGVNIGDGIEIKVHFDGPGPQFTPTKGGIPLGATASDLIGQSPVEHRATVQTEIASVIGAVSDLNSVVRDLIATLHPVLDENAAVFQGYVAGDPSTDSPGPVNSVGIARECPEPRAVVDLRRINEWIHTLRTRVLALQHGIRI